MSSVLSTRLTTIEELRVIFDWSVAGASENVVPWHRILQHFPRIFQHFLSVKTLRLEGTRCNHMARVFHQGHGGSNNLVLLPALEEIQLGKNSRFAYLTFQPFVSTRQQAGRPVKVFLLQ